MLSNVILFSSCSDRAALWPVLLFYETDKTRLTVLQDLEFFIMAVYEEEYEDEFENESNVSKNNCFLSSVVSFFYRVLNNNFYIRFHKKKIFMQKRKRTSSSIIISC